MYALPDIGGISFVVFVEVFAMYQVRVYHCGIGTVAGK